MATSSSFTSRQLLDTAQNLKETNEQYKLFYEGLERLFDTFYGQVRFIQLANAAKCAEEKRDAAESNTEKDVYNFAIYKILDEVEEVLRDFVDVSQLGIAPIFWNIVDNA